MVEPKQSTHRLENQAQHLNYYPHWLDSLADEVILQGAVFNGELRGAQQVGKMLSFARSLYAFQEFRFYGMRGDLFLEDYRSRIRGTEAYHPPGVEIYNFVVVYFNDAGETSQLVMNHRPQSAALLFSSLLAKHFGDAFDPSLFYGGDVSAHLLNRDLSRGLWPGSSSGPDGASEAHSRWPAGCVFPLTSPPWWQHQMRCPPRTSRAGSDRRSVRTCEPCA